MTTNEAALPTNGHPRVYGDGLTRVEGGLATAYTVTRVVLRSCILCGEQERNAAGGAQRELTYAEAMADRNARCTRCGGSLALEFESRRVRLEPEIDWYADRPRRGRPPKALRQRLQLNTDPKVNA